MCTQIHASMLSAAALACAVGVAPHAAHAQPVPPCGSFVEVANPGQDVEGTVLMEVAAWQQSGFAVGRYYPTGSGAFVPTLYRYASGNWSDHSLPSISGLGTEPVLMSVGMSPATGDAAWVVGYITVNPPTNNLPLIARWRGGGFDRVEAPALRPQTEYPYGGRSGFAYDVSVIAEDDVWAVGQAGGFGDAQTSSVAMALHFDGSGWEDVPTPIVSNRSHRFDAVSASASTNVWAVGTTRTIAGPFLGFICRWDGSSWSAVSHPALSIPQSQFHAVLALSPSDVWVAGAINYTDPLLYRYNGSSWQSVPLPGGSGVIALAGTAANDIYATTAGAVTSIFHWDGASWTEVPNPAPAAGKVDSARSLAIAGECDVWSVGAVMDSTGFLGALIEHLVPGSPACPADFTGDNAATVPDIFAFLSLWFAGNAAADFNGDGSIGVPDIFAFLSAWFAGC